MKPLDDSQPLRPGKPGDVFPFLVTLQDLYRHRAGKLFIDATVLFNLPHAELCIYHKWYVKIGRCLVTHNVEVAGAARLYRVASVLTAGLCWS
jgi:hypothetical protein